jgi:hypothetical protein
VLAAPLKLALDAPCCLCSAVLMPTFISTSLTSWASVALLFGP